MLKNKAKEVNKVRETLSRINSHLWTNIDIYQCCDRIAWLAKFGYLTNDEIEELTSKATAILEKGGYDDN